MNSSGNSFLRRRLPKALPKESSDAAWSTPAKPPRCRRRNASRRSSWASISSAPPVMTGGALEIDAHEDLRDALRRLHLGGLAGVDHAAPDDSFGKAFGSRRRRNEFPDEFIVRHVRQQRRIQPRGNLLASAIDVTSAFVIIAQKIVPESQPMLGVSVIVREQLFYEPLAFARLFVGNEGPQLLGRGQQPNDIEISAPREQAIVDRFRGLEFVGRVI